MPKSTAVVLGAGGGIGGALCEELTKNWGYEELIAYTRSQLDLEDEESIQKSAYKLKEHSVRLVINATGLLHKEDQKPEKSLRELNTTSLTKSFAINAIGPALVLKHFIPILPRRGRSTIAHLSARVGSIGDNRLGGWYGYRASKAALNQFVRTAAIELGRTHPEAICIALHPGTVKTKLSSPYIQGNHNPTDPIAAAKNLLSVIKDLKTTDSGGFFDWQGRSVEW